MYRKCSLKIGCLNIGGNAKMKCTTPDIIDIIKRHDIFIVIETWLGSQDACPQIKGYMNFCSERKKKCKAKRNSGGLIIYYRQELGKGVCKLASDTTDIIWVKLDRLFFGTNKDIYICAAYISPQNSSSNSGISLDDKFEGLHKELDWYTTIGDVAIIGDLNSRVGTIQERHIGFNMDPNAVEITTIDYVPPRRSFDKNVNAYGRKLLQILTDYDLMITNGRVWGDLTGRYTCCQRNGCSVVDMLLVQNDLFRIIDYFQIYDFDWSSLPLYQ